MMRRVYGRATSSNVQVVMWALAELGLEAERLDYGHAHGGRDTDAYGAMNPHRKIPVLVEGDLVVWESSAILRYLAARYGDGGAFWPSDPVARAGVDMWAEWGKTELCAGFTRAIFWPRVRTPAKDRDEGRLAAAVAAFNAQMAILNTRLEGRDHVCGHDFTLADIVIGSLLYRWFDIDVARDPAPNVEAYYDRLTTRPAYREHVMVSYAPLVAEGA
jgi:glutathione S-transferase